MQTKSRSIVDYYERKYEILSKFKEQDGEGVLQLFEQAQEDLRSDLEVVIQALGANIDCIKFCSQNILSDREIIRMAVQMDGQYLSLVEHTDLAKDRELVYLACCSGGESAMGYADYSLRNDKEFMLNIFQNCSIPAYHYLGDDLLDDREVALAAITTNGQAFRVFSNDIRNDKEMFMKALRTAPNCIADAGDDIRYDRDMVLKAVKLGTDISNIPSQFANDREIASLCLKYNHWAFNHIGDELKNDREFVMEAIRHGCSLSTMNQFTSDKEIVLLAINTSGGESIQYASDELKNDNECVLAAIRSQPSALRYVGDQFKSNKELVCEILQTHGYLFYELSDELKADKELLFIALNGSHPNALTYASPELKADRDVMMEAVRINGNCLQYATTEMKNDFDIVMEAIKQGASLEFASPDLRDNWELCQAVSLSDNYRYFGPMMKKNRDLAIQAIDEFGCNYSYIDDSLKQDEELAWRAVMSENSYGLNISDFDEKFQHDRRMMLELIKKNSYQFEHLWQPFKNLNIIYWPFGASVRYIRRSFSKDTTSECQMFL